MTEKDDRAGEINDRIREFCSNLADHTGRDAGTLRNLMRYALYSFGPEELWSDPVVVKGGEAERRLDKALKILLAPLT
jgi:hypothetical protein